MSTKRNRQPAGQPVGGQFAAQSRASSGIDLEPRDSAEAHEDERDRQVFEGTTADGPSDYIFLTDSGMRNWTADDEDDARKQQYEAFPQDRVLRVDAGDSDPVGMSPGDVAQGVVLGAQWDAESVAHRDGWTPSAWEKYNDVIDLHNEDDDDDDDDGAYSRTSWDGAQTAMFTSDIDDALVVQVDTASVEDGRRVRVTINDGNVYDGDPEKDENPAPVSEQDLHNMHAVMMMQMHGSKARMATDPSSPEIISGSFRHGMFDADGNRTEFADIRASHVRFTDDVSGQDRYIPFGELTTKFGQGLLAATEEKASP